MKTGFSSIIAGFVFTLFGALNAYFFYSATFESRTSMGSFPLGKHQMCILHHNDKIGGGTIESWYENGIQAKGIGTIQLLFNKTILTAPYEVSLMTNMLDQLIEASFRISYLDNTISFIANKPSPIEVTGAFTNKTKSVQHTISMQGPIFFKTKNNRVTIHNSNAEVTNSLVTQTALQFSYDDNCTIHTEKPFLLDDVKLFKFFEKTL